MSRDLYGGRGQGRQPRPRPASGEAPRVSDYAADARLGKGGLAAVADACDESSYMTGVQIVVDGGMKVW